MKNFREINSWVIYFRKSVTFTKFLSKMHESEFPTSSVWKNVKFSLTAEKFRQSNSLVTYLVKPLIWRNFCQKSVKENLRNFHSALCFRNFHTINSVNLWKIFRENDCLRNTEAISFYMHMQKKIIICYLKIISWKRL